LRTFCQSEKAKPERLVDRSSFSAPLSSTLSRGRVDVARGLVCVSPDPHPTSRATKAMMNPLETAVRMTPSYPMACEDLVLDHLNEMPSRQKLRTVMAVTEDGIPKATHSIFW
jgi:hypothetical protein